MMLNWKRKSEVLSKIFKTQKYLPVLSCIHLISMDTVFSLSLPYAQDWDDVWSVWIVCSSQEPLVTQLFLTFCIGLLISALYFLLIYLKFLYVMIQSVSCSLTFLSPLFFLMCEFLCSICVVIWRRWERRGSGTPSGCCVPSLHSSNVSLFGISNPQ